MAVTNLISLLDDDDFGEDLDTLDDRHDSHLCHCSNTDEGRGHIGHKGMEEKKPCTTAPQWSALGFSSSSLSPPQPMMKRVWYSLCNIAPRFRDATTNASLPLCRPVMNGSATIDAIETTAAEQPHRLPRIAAADLSCLLPLIQFNF